MWTYHHTKVSSLRSLRDFKKHDELCLKTFIYFVILLYYNSGRFQKIKLQINQYKEANKYHALTKNVNFVTKCFSDSLGHIYQISLCEFVCACVLV